MDSARTGAVVVPAPATSPVLLATFFTSLAPMFSKGCGSSISLATVTPSLVTRGDPKDFCRMTLRPRGPSVAFTARANWPSPLAISMRASDSYFICLAAMTWLRFGFDFYVSRGGERARGDKLFRLRVDSDVEAFQTPRAEQ